MRALKAIIDARYAGTEHQAGVDTSIAQMATGIAENCRTTGYDPALSGAYSYAQRKKLLETQEATGGTPLETFGPWTAFRYFGSDGFDGYDISAYRTPTGPDGSILSITLSAPSMMGNHAKVLIERSGKWTVRATSWVDQLQIVIPGTPKIDLIKTGQTGESSQLGETTFELSAETMAELLALDDDVELSFLGQPSGISDWVEYENFMDNPGRLPVARLKQAFDWATAPVAPDL